MQRVDDGHAVELPVLGSRIKAHVDGEHLLVDALDQPDRVVRKRLAVVFEHKARIEQIGRTRALYFTGIEHLERALTRSGAFHVVVMPLISYSANWMPSM